MSYASWSVVFGEQPSASKWNILGTNDAFFNTQVGSNFGSGTTSTVWWEELGRTTLGSAGDTISVATVAARRYLNILIYGIGPNITTALRFNNDSGNNYSRRNNTNGAETTNTSESSGVVASAANVTHDFISVEVINISTQEKLYISETSSPGAAGAATAPNRKEVSGKWANTSSQITRVDAINSGTGDFAIGSEVVVLGHD